MARTVNYGIDLGTTNSAVARMTRKGSEIIPVKRKNYIPSAVAVDKRGSIKVGDDALNPLLQSARAFKRLMGTESKIELSSNLEMTPSQLSAEVLKALKSAVKTKTDDDLVNVVITVPAMFNQPQCSATSHAAELAGLVATVLLQEPIAAATAYLSENPHEGYFLVYDLGGGTFDASLIQLKDGEMNVIEHGGDNYLGGTDFDRALFEWVLDQIDRKGGDTEMFKTDSLKIQLMEACEEARIELSDQERANIYLDDFDLPLTKIEIDRENLEDLVEDLVTRTIEITQKIVTNAGLTQPDIKEILLVGGPTQMPYVRERLRADLSIALNLDQDPMTVVAKGAAIHASTLLIHDIATSQVIGNPETMQIQLHYDPVCPEASSFVAGKLISHPNFKGELQVRNNSGDWESGWIPLKNGAFSVEVRVLESLNEFTIVTRDLMGTEIPCEPKSFVIRSGVRTAQPVTPYNYGVVLEGGTKIERIVSAGQSLPASGSTTLRIAQKLLAGSPDVRRFYVVEGHTDFAEDCVNIGSVELKGTDITRTLQENEAVEVRIRIDESRGVKGSFYFPLLDEEFHVVAHSILESPNVQDLGASLEETRISISEIEDHTNEEDRDEILKVERELEQLEAVLERVESGETDEAARVHKQLTDSKSRLRPLKEKYGLVAKHQGTIDFINEADTLCVQFKDEMGRAKLEDLRSDANKALRLNQEKSLDAIFERTREIFWEHYGKTRDCWEYQVERLRQMAARSTDPITYFEIVRRAGQALENNDFDGVAIEVVRARELLPERARVQNRFYDAALRK